jgi:hypothetical protein
VQDRETLLRVTRRGESKGGEEQEQEEEEQEQEQEEKEEKEEEEVESMILREDHVFIMRH